MLSSSKHCKQRHHLKDAPKDGRYIEGSKRLRHKTLWDKCNNLFNQNTLKCTDWHWWVVGKPMVDFLFAFLAFFAIFTVPELRVNVYSSAVFVGGRPLCTHILPGRGRPPPTTLGVRKLHTLGYSTVKTASLCVSSFWYNSGVWRTDRRTDGSDVAAERCKNWPLYLIIYLYCFHCASYASAVAVVILSVCPSVCLSHACYVTKLNNALRTFWCHTKGQSF